MLVQLERHRYRCQECGQVTQQHLEGIKLRSGMTLRLEEYIAKESLRTDKNFRMVADEVGVDEKTVRNIFTRRVKLLARSWRFEAPRCLGIDEVYINGVARCILTDVEGRRLVNILNKRDMLSLRRHLLQIKRPDRVEVVVIDMWRPYMDEARLRFPHAAVVIDKYHVLREATAAVMAVRNKLRSRDRRLVMPKPHLLRKRVYDLPPAQRAALENSLADLPDLGAAHKLKEEFFNIWNVRDRHEAETRIDRWVGSIPQHLQYAFSDLTTSLANWREEILNYFEYRVTNAFTESINNIIKSIQRTGRGYSFDVLRAKLVYGGPFVTRRPVRPVADREGPPSDGRKARTKKRARGGGLSPSPQANVQQLGRVRQSEDEFTRLMRPPEAYVKRFGHLIQLAFPFDTPDLDEGK